jgi:predicted RNA-binding Zn ribbon-like protein
VIEDTLMTVSEPPSEIEVSAPVAEREPAPEPLELVRQFVNTFDVESGREVFADAASVQAWFRERDLLGSGVRLKPADVRRVIELREAIRALLLANNGVPLESEAVDVLNAVAERTPLEARFDASGTIGVTGRSAGIDGALGQILAVVVQSVADDTWSRLKACRDHECHWAFYDHSRNRSGQWCVMAVCGNRNKARTYRKRQRGS